MTFHFVPEVRLFHSFIVPRAGLSSNQSRVPGVCLGGRGISEDAELKNFERWYNSLRVGKS